jgi:hypothetical protein
MVRRIMMALFDPLPRVQGDGDPFGGEQTP